MKKFDSIADIKIPDYLAEYMVRLYFKLSEELGGRAVFNGFVRSPYLDDKINRRVFSRITDEHVRKYIDSSNSVGPELHRPCFSFKSAAFEDGKPLRLYLVQYEEGSALVIENFRLASDMFVIHGSTIIIN